MEKPQQFSGWYLRVAFLLIFVMRNLFLLRTPRIPPTADSSIAEGRQLDNVAIGKQAISGTASRRGVTGNDSARRETRSLTAEGQNA